MVIVWSLRGNIIRTALCWIVWHNVHSLQHTYMSSPYRCTRLGLSHWDCYSVRRGGCLELYYCNMVEWFRWDSSLISTTNWFTSVPWHCWFSHLACKNPPEMTYYVSSGTLNPTRSHSVLVAGMLSPRPSLALEAQETCLGLGLIITGLGLMTVVASASSSLAS